MEKKVKREFLYAGRDLVGKMPDYPDFSEGQYSVTRYCVRKIRILLNVVV